MENTAETIYIYVTTGYSVKRLFEKEEIEDYEDNFPEETKGMKIMDLTLEVMARYPSVINFIECRDDDKDTVIKIFDHLERKEFYDADRWSPIFKCTSIHKALKLLPKIFKICREINWCEIWKDQDFLKALKGPFKMNDKESVYVLALSAESG